MPVLTGKKTHNTKTDHVDCTCIFCNSKCPECGSTDIRISYRPQFECDNDTENELVFSQIDDQISVECNECGAWIEDSEELYPLANAINSALGLPSILKASVDENCNINIKNY